MSNCIKNIEYNNCSQCFQPWFEIQVLYDQTVGCCCYYHGKKTNWNFQNNSTVDIDTFWNSEEMQQVRRVIKQGNASDTGCSNCQSLEYGIPNLRQNTPSYFLESQQTNYQKALNNFHNKTRCIDSFPVHYYFNFGLPCNLECVMCSQAEIKQINQDILPTKLFEKFEPFFKYAESITIIGGEPFVIPEAREFIKKINNSSQKHHLKIKICSNGTLLDKYHNHFDKIPMLNFTISLDSIGQNYEYIRRGATWKKTEKNILQLKQLGEQKGHQWNISIASVLMKSSLSNIIPFINWCIKHDLYCHFVPIAPNRLNTQEDIFSYPQLLDKISEWEAILDEAISILTRAERIHNAADNLQHMKIKLKNIHLLYKQKPQLFSSPELITNDKLFAEIGSKKFMIWGTSGYYNLNFAETIESHEQDNFLGFIDNNSSTWGKTIANKTVYKPDQIKALNPDVIIIASAMRKEILKQIVESNLDNHQFY